MGYIKPWSDSFPPFQIFGNLYYVGTIPTSVHLVDTGDGLIVFDTGYQASLYLIIDNIYRMGFDPHQIKYIFLTHGHIDHLGGARSLKELTGAEIAIGEADRDYANGKLDLTYAKEFGMCYRETFEPDIMLNDGDWLSIGNTVIRTVATPGHTPGAMSYFFSVTDGEKTFTAALHGGAGTNTMSREFLDRYGLSYSCRSDFKRSMDRLSNEQADIFLGNHMWQNHTPEKYKRLRAGDRLAFVDPKELAEYSQSAKQDLINMEETEKHET